MFCSCKKFVAILMLILFPLSGSSALAATESLQMDGTYHGMAMPTIQPHQGNGLHKTNTSHEQHGNSCSDKGTCQLSCIGYLAPPFQELASVQLEMKLVTPYLVSFTSVTSAPLNPPPLA
jgi:hypothetical protein